jgi:hypothetical protein
VPIDAVFETIKFEVEAVPETVIAVDEAYGNVEARVDVAVTYATVGEVDEMKAPESLIPIQP